MALQLDGRFFPLEMDYGQENTEKVTEVEANLAAEVSGTRHIKLQAPITPAKTLDGCPLKSHKTRGGISTLFFLNGRM